MSQAEVEFSERLESVRKDVECTFGILKKRFVILKHAIELHSKDHIDYIFFGCCILHNMLLIHDGYDKKWEFEDIPLESQSNTHKRFRQRVREELASGNTDYSYTGLDPLKTYARGTFGNDTRAQVETLHEHLKNKLIANFKYMLDNSLVRWN